jgi:uncharacterized protein YcbK (DUF882 family)
LIDFAQQNNLPLTFTSGYRDQAKQNEIRKDPRSITPATRSNHSLGRAVDFSARRMTIEQAKSLVHEAQRIGLRWGGIWGDRVHFDQGRPPLGSGFNSARTDFEESIQQGRGNE